MPTRRPHIDHGFDSGRRLGDKPLPHKSVALGHVDGATQVGGDIVGRILRTGNVHDHLGFKVAWKRGRLADINNQMAVALVFDRRRRRSKPTTSWPSSKKRCTHAAPIPPEAPVIKTRILAP